MSSEQERPRSPEGIRLLAAARQADHDEIRTVKITGGMLWDIADEIEALEAGPLYYTPNTLYALLYRWEASDE